MYFIIKSCSKTQPVDSTSEIWSLDADTCFNVDYIVYDCKIKTMKDNQISTKKKTFVCLL